MLDLGAMRHRVRIQKQTNQRDAAGERLDEWIEVVSRRASVERAPGAEPFASDQRQGRVPTTFRLRFVEEEILPEMRLLFEGRVFNIRSAIDPDGMRRETVITAEELVEEVP